MPKEPDLLESVVALHHEVSALRQRVQLVECFIDGRHRERSGWTLDDIRQIWHGQPSAADDPAGRVMLNPAGKVVSVTEQLFKP